MHSFTFRMVASFQPILGMCSCFYLAKHGEHDNRNKYCIKVGQMFGKSQWNFSANTDVQQKQLVILHFCVKESAAKNGPKILLSIPSLQFFCIVSLFFGFYFRLIYQMPQDGTSCIFAITSTGWASGVGCSQGHGLRATTILRLDSTTSRVAGMYQYRRW